MQPNLSQYVGGVSVSQRIFDFGFSQNTVGSVQLAERVRNSDINARQALAVLNVQASYLKLKTPAVVQIAEETVRERGIIKGQIEALHRQQLKSSSMWIYGPGRTDERRIASRQGSQRTQIQFCQPEPRHGCDGSRVINRP